MEFNKLESAGYLANHMARLFAQGLQDRIQALGLSPGQFPTLIALWAEDGLTQKELVRRIDVEQATIANTLNRMERDGLVVRKRHPEDGRSQQIWLTEKAIELKEPATGAAMTLNSIALKDFSTEERAVFVELMQRVIKSIRDSRRDGA